MPNKYSAIENDTTVIDILDISIRYYNALRRHGIHKVDDLVLLVKQDRLDTVKRLGESGRKEIVEKLEQYVNKTNDSAFSRAQKRQQLLKTNDRSPETPINNLSANINLLHINKRYWKILRLRSLGATLQDIGNEMGVSRARIQQIESAALKNFFTKTILFTPFFDFLEKHSDKFDVSVEEKVSIDLAAKRLQGLYLIYSKSELSFDDANKIIVLLRTFPKLSNHKNKQRWSKIIFKACSVYPYITQNEKTEKKLEELKKKNKKLSYTELAYQVLNKVGKPLHWQEIAERAESLKKRKNFNAAAIYNMLQGKKDVFVRVEAGTYGLTEWGLQEAEYYTYIIARVLHESGKALSFGAIFLKVDAIRQIEKTSLLMFLDLNPRFYRSKSDTYGLRAWLPPRHKQTLLTPQHLIEDAKSFERVEKAIERGYDVDEIINRDKQLSKE